jgi:hypothetical protein
MSEPIIKFVITVVLIAIVIAVAYKYYRTEGFTTNDTVSDHEKIIQTYNEILQRDPTVKELKSVKYNMETNDLNFYKLRIILYSSDEYSQIVKMQTNSATPELKKMIVEREYVEKINEIYKDMFDEKINSDLVLPYHDLYVYKFNLTDALLKAMFQDDRYGDFEVEVLATNDLDRDKLFDIYYENYEKPRGKKKKKAKVIPSSLPQPYYILVASAIGNDAAPWKVSNGKVKNKIYPPWKSPDDPEFTYHRNVEYDDQAGYEEPTGLQSSIYPSTKKPKPVDMYKPLPIPQAPLQPTLLGMNLSFSPLTMPKPEIEQIIKPTMYLNSPVTLNSIIFPKYAKSRQVSDIYDTKTVCQ